MTPRARIALLSGLLGLATACGGGDTPDPAPPPASVTVTTSATAPLVDTTVTIRARVLTAAGAPVAPGTAVGFAATGGTISNVTATDAAGDATARLTSAAHGALTVIVTVGSLPARTQSITFIDPDEPFGVDLTAAAAVADVGTTVRLTARVTPTGPAGTGDPTATIADGTVVTFRSSAGTITEVTTTAGGEATATLGGLSAPAMVFVTASAGSVESLPVLVEFTDSTVPASVALAGAPAAGFTGDQGPVALTATVLTLSGAPVPVGSPVAFAVTAGAGTLSAAGAQTDAAGRASVTLRSAVAGTVTVTATATGGVTGTLSAAFTDPSRPVALSLASSTPTARLDGQVPVLLTVSLAPADPAHGRIPDGTPVAFTIVAGTATLSSPAAATAGGVASVALASAAEGSVTVRASAGALADTVTVVFSNPSRPAAVALSANPPAGRLDVGGPITLTATVAPADPLLGRIADGTAVAFAVTAGSGTLSSLAAVTADGVASVTLAGGAVGTVSVRATVGAGAAAVSGSTTVTFTNPSRPVALSLAASPVAGRLDAPGPITLTATVTPADPSLGAIPDGTPVAFAVSAGTGTLSAASAPTTGGRASVSLFSAVEGSVAVTATVAGAVQGTVTVAFSNPSKPVALSLAASPPGGRLDGGGPVTLTATVTPANPAVGAIADGTQVAFAVTGGDGTLSAATALTTGGRASVTLSSAVEGSVAVRATVAGPVSGTATVAFTNPSKPVALALAANPPAGRLDGAGPVTLTAVVTPADPALGAIADGTPVTFAVTGGSGTLSSATALTAGGVAVTTLAGGAEGSVTVTATVAGSVQGAVAVPFTNPSRPAAIALAASPGSGRTGGQGPVTLSATVAPVDQVLGRVADGTLVSFAITGGTGSLSAPTALTANGVASVTLNAAAAGTVTVTASVGSPAITSAPVSVPFVVQPTLAIVRIRTSGALAAGAAIGGVSAVVTASPSAGLSLSDADVSASGAAAGALLAVNPASLAATRLALISAAGFQPGEVATLTFHVAPGTFPAAQDFSVALSGPGVVDLAGETLPLAVAVEGVTIQ